MSRTLTRLMKAGLSALHYSGAGDLVSPLTRGCGVILMMHRVSPEPVRDFEPNRILRVTPGFLDDVVRQMKAQHFEFIAMDAVRARLAEPDPSRPFACITFDDGYRDNLHYAFPILRRHNVPHTLYVPTDYPDGRGDLWWLMLEAAIRQLDAVTVPFAAGPRTFSCRSTRDKYAAYHTIYWHLRSLPEDDARRIVGGLASDAGLATSKLCSELIIDWDELRAAASDPLLTIGAHTCRHYALGKLSDAEVRHEMIESKQRIERELGQPCRHFSYPYGCERAAGPREFAMASSVGFETAVTTRKGLVHARHAAEPTAIPRLSLNGDFQQLRYLDAMLSGVPFAMWNLARRVAPPLST